MAEPDYAHNPVARRNRWVKAARLAAAARTQQLRTIHGLTGTQRTDILARAEVTHASDESWALAHQILVYPDGLPHLPITDSGVPVDWLTADIDAVTREAGVIAAYRRPERTAQRAAYDTWDEQRAAAEALRLAGYGVTEQTTPTGKPAILIEQASPVLPARYHLARAGIALDAMGDAIAPLTVPPAVLRAVLLDMAAEILDADDPAAALLAHLAEQG